MLQVARLAPQQLGESRDLVASFLRSRLNADGGFQNRSGESDLYYTVFGLEGLTALQEPLPSAEVIPYLQRFGVGADLDLVHLACLARSWANVTPARRTRAHSDVSSSPENVRAAPGVGSRPAPARAAVPDEARAVRSVSTAIDEPRIGVPAQQILARLERYRSDDGGYAHTEGAPHGNAYAAFLVLGACQDLHGALPDAGRLVESLDALRASDGGYANLPGDVHGITTVTAAAVLVRKALEAPLDPLLGVWLLDRCQTSGGFVATPATPIPDLLSTATALHALASLHVPLGGVQEPCLDFLDSLWTNRGGFYGSWVDEALDCEYTYYGLLALGHLTVAS